MDLQSLVPSSRSKVMHVHVCRIIARNEGEPGNKARFTLCLLWCYIYILFLMRDERRKEERSKQGQTN